MAKTKKFGIDVSIFQGEINWGEVVADNIKFAMIKASQGHSVRNYNTYLFQDKYFARNVVEAHKHGVPVGVYHYLTARTTADAVVEAEYFIKVITPYKDRIKFWAAVDVEEGKYLPETKNALTAVVDTFCRVVQRAGFKPMVYTNPNYLKHKLNDISEWPLWLALWRSLSFVPSTKTYPNMKIWQYGGRKVKGIYTKEKVDADLAIDIPELNGKINYADEVCRKCGLEGQTRNYIDKYKYADDLWRKLYEQMK